MAFLDCSFHVCFINIVSNIRLKSIVNASAVFCKVQIGSSQRFYTEVASCNHDINRGSYGISLRIDQGFILYFYLIPVMYLQIQIKSL